METLQLDLAPLSPLNPTEGQAGDVDAYKPELVCAKMIHYKVEDHKLTKLHFTGGCEGNLTAISKLLEGMDIDDVVDKLSGITCGKKDTSCADQLCNALKGHMDD
ncbi:TIGR03905 family TSCPD domain-containing protein [Pseudodesulfovibrio sp. zrk46]|uniref:TIGR03905 family TSCPD domain-containing protein n=1 Tax=Pseudodesulfovibrio sp. zrk46 TaxID=2725288 RepID=UPI00144940BE|nr:TIGR03905 family TSCPD domain-containing protein [Pseudodesulfovibrio sp. zrk46]QJB56728.1 TIGR03905 family TSCPD domain-containing protein [Pseudodesulfovibrio sp. zrk46]